MYEVVDEHGNVFIRIPKFYTRITRNPNGTYKHQLSGYRYEGFTTLFVDGHGFYAVRSTRLHSRAVAVHIAVHNRLRICGSHFEIGGYFNGIGKKQNLWRG